jgi:hypothetical protein
VREKLNQFLFNTPISIFHGALILLYAGSVIAGITVGMRKPPPEPELTTISVLRSVSEIDSTPAPTPEPTQALSPSPEQF